MNVHLLRYHPATDLRAALDRLAVEDSDRLLIQVFTPSTKPHYVRGVLHELRQRYPAAVLVGASSSATLAEGGISDSDIVITFLAFEEARLRTTFVSFPEHQTPDCLATGKSLGRAVASEETRAVLCFAAGARLNAEDLARGVMTALPNVVLSGCLASGAGEQDVPFVCVGEDLFSSGVVLVALSGRRLHARAWLSPDWMMLGTPMTVTEAEDNVVRTINERSALDIYRRYLGPESCDHMPATCSRFPLLTERNGHIVARPGKAVLPDGAVELWGNLQPGEAVRFGLLNPVSAMDQAQRLLDTLKRECCEVVLLFPSVARRLLMRSLTEDELELFGGLAPVAGLFTTGQFLYTPEFPDYLHYAQTGLCLTEGRSARRHQPLPDLSQQYSRDTLELRVMSHLVNTTARELEAANQALERLANTDALTGIYNRHRAQRLLEQEYRRAQRYGRPLSLIMLDIDNFKAVNDSLGHQQGDKALKALARSIQPLIRDTDYFARWGGEEFLIICPETDLEGTHELAERLRARVAARPLLPGRSLTISVGVTSYRQEDTLDELLSRVDRALYHSKQQGKNRVTVWR